MASPSIERVANEQWRRLVVFAALVILVLWLARGILPPFVIAGVIAYAFGPVVAAAVRRTGLPRPAVVAGLYVVALALIAAVVAVVAGRLAEELGELASGGPAAIADLVRSLLGHDAVRVGSRSVSATQIATALNDAIAQSLATPTDALHAVQLAGDLALQAVLVVIVTFYLLVDGPRIGSAAVRFLPSSERPRALAIAGHVHEVLGRWLRGQVALIALVALALYVVLGPVLHVPYALALATLSGVLEIIPLVGPIIAAALAALVAFSHDGASLAIAVLVVYLVVREVEDQVVTPLVIGRAVHLHPVVTIFAVLAGISVWGVLGGLLAVPAAAALNVTFNELFPSEAAEGPVE